MKNYDILKEGQWEMKNSLPPGGLPLIDLKSGEQGFEVDVVLCVVIATFSFNSQHG